MVGKTETISEWRVSLEDAHPPVHPEGKAASKAGAPLLLESSAEAEVKVRPKSVSSKAKLVS